jgi:hypothetical protein
VRSPAGLAAERALERRLFSGALPEEVRLDCIYTREDAVVDWRACIDPDPRARAHEVSGTHCGLAWSVQVYRLVARLLAERHTP